MRATTSLRSAAPLRRQAFFSHKFETKEARSRWGGWKPVTCAQWDLSMRGGSMYCRSSLPGHLPPPPHKKKGDKNESDKEGKFELVTTQGRS